MLEGSNSKLANIPRSTADMVTTPVQKLLPDHTMLSSVLSRCLLTQVFQAVVVSVTLLSFLVKCPVSFKHSQRGAVLAE